MSRMRSYKSAAAAMATELGLVIAAAIAALIVLGGALQGAHLFEGRHP